MRRFPPSVRLVLLGGVALIAALAGWQGQAIAATTTYTCSGLTTDQASYDLTPGNNVRSSAAVLALLHSTISTFPANPALAIDITPTVPGTATAGTPFAAEFDFSATLPDALVSGAQGIGLTSVTATNATFNIGVDGGAPGTLSGVVASKSVPLVSGATITQAVTGNVTGTTGTIEYHPGAVSLGLALNVTVLTTHIGTISVNCSPSDSTLATTAVTSGSSTTGSTSSTSTSTSTSTSSSTSTTTTTAGGSGSSSSTTTTTGSSTTTTTKPSTTTTTGSSTTTTTRPSTTTTTVRTAVLGASTVPLVDPLVAAPSSARTQVLGTQESRASLPFTGTDSTLLAGVGVLLVLSGAALAIGARRGRAQA